jgi:serine/threonine-protein kinase
MKLLLVCLLLSVAAAFVVLSSGSLPPKVASHFVVGGAANAYMPRGAYVELMLEVVVGAPALLIAVSTLVRFVPTRFLNLPNRAYWLAPERRAETLAFLQYHGAFLGLLLAAFLCFVHWLVVRANAQHPPLFPESSMNTGLVLFLAAVVVWLGVLVVRFRRHA